MFTLPPDDDWDDLSRKGQLRRLHIQLLKLERTFTVTFADFAAQEDTEVADLAALGTALDQLLALVSAQSTQLTQFITDSQLAPADQAKLQDIIDTTNAQLAKVQAALPQPPAPPPAG